MQLFRKSTKQKSRYTSAPATAVAEVDVYQIMPELLNSALTAKAANYGAKAGGVIVGNLARGGDGKFTSAGAASAAKPANKKPTGSDAANNKKAQIAADRQKRKDEEAAKRAQEKQDIADAKSQQEISNVGDITESLLGGDMAEVLTTGDGVGDLDGVKPEYGDQLVKNGLATKYDDGTYELSPSGKSYVNAAKKGNELKAKHALQRAQRLQAKREAAAARPKRKRKEFTGATGFRVYKSASGAWRWLAISSSAFEDRDGETVSLKALSADCDRADADGAYGPLRWFHVPGLDIGNCDFNAMQGRLLVESGTIKNEKIALALAEKSADLELSIGFVHPITEPDSSGVYHNIMRFERSVMPRGNASNRLTQFSISRGQNMQLKEKVAAFMGLFDNPDEATAALKEIISTASTKEVEALAAGLKYKAAGDPAPTGGADPGAGDPGEAGEAGENPNETENDNEFVGDLTVAEFREVMTAIIKNAVTGMAKTDAADAAANPAPAPTDAAATAATTKAVEDLAALRSEYTALIARLETAEKAVKELSGDVPRAVQRASTSAATILAPDSVFKSAGPRADDRDEYERAADTIVKGIFGSKE